ncbi:hypothetical protein M8J77_001738 [Diaphorina citri]|nr:hypothetical protein M8J77_001738 [Diaphorina citri]
MEYLFMEVWCSGSKFLLGVVYRPPSTPFLDDFETLLMDFIPHYNDVIIMGDFNCNLLKNDSAVTNFRNVVSSVNLSILPTSATYHIPACSSLLDLMLVIAPRKVKDFHNVGAPGFSNHDLVHLSYDLRCPKSKHKIVQYRDYRNLNVELLRDEARAQDWGAVRRRNCVDEKVDILTNIISSLFDKHVPLKTSRVRRPPAPWFTDVIKRTMKRRDRAHAAFRRTRSRQHWDRYRRLRNECNRLCRDSRREDIAHNVEDGHSANTWHYLKSLGVGEDSESRSDTLLIDVNELNNHFVKPPIVLSPDIKLHSLDIIESQPSPDCESFVFSQCTEDEVMKALTSIKSNAVGNDNIVLNPVSVQGIARLRHFSRSLKMYG